MRAPVLVAKRTSRWGRSMTTHVDRRIEPGNVVPFRRPRGKRPRRERIIVFAIRAGALKQAVFEAYYKGLIQARDVEDVFGEYGLKHD